jgi:endonuclease/exonuclease/phosphatase (EEP) superfamily protein YafD
MPAEPLPSPPDDAFLDMPREQSMTLRLTRASVRRAAWAATLLLCALTIAGFFGWVWPWELCSHFRVQYAWGLGALTAVWLAARRPRPALVAAAGVLVNAALILPLYRNDASASTAVPHASYRALLFNVDVSNTDTASTLRLIRDADPDVVLLVEPNHRWIAALESLTRGYPCHETVGIGFGYGIALYTRLPCDSIQVVDVSRQGRPSIIARLTLPAGRLTVIGAHPLTPLAPTHLAARNRHLAELGRLAGAQSTPVMLMGDLNTTSWSAAFGALLRQGRLRDSRLGFGLQASWPTFLPALAIPIDHVLVSPGIQVERRALGPDVGSDHRPVLVDFTLVD